MEYLKLFENHSLYEDFIETEDFVRPNVSHCVSENEVHYNSHDYSGDYLTIKALENGTIGFSFNSYGRPGSFNYSIDNGETWETLDSQNNEISVSSNDTVLFKKEPSRMQTPDVYFGNFYSTCKFEAYGNPLSLIYGSSFLELTLISNESLMYLFSDCTKLMSAKHISLPAVTLGNKCYSYMFLNCINIKIAPELPATTLATRCYEGMFKGCRSLKAVPELPATTLKYACYLSMFEGCTNIKIAPELPGTILEGYCYANMFSGCTNLVVGPSILPATSINNLTAQCYNGMFKGCIKLETAPTLPAIDFGNSSYIVSDKFYYQMFLGCHRLNYIKCYLRSTYKNCITDWLTDVSKDGVYVANISYVMDSTIEQSIPSNWIIIYYDETLNKYYLDRQRENECDDHGIPILQK